jgi:hypothetical protein
MSGPDRQIMTTSSAPPSTATLPDSFIPLPQGCCCHLGVIDPPIKYSGNDLRVHARVFPCRDVLGDCGFRGNELADFLPRAARSLKIRNSPRAFATRPHRPPRHRQSPRTKRVRERSLPPCVGAYRDRGNRAERAPRYSVQPGPSCLSGFRNITAERTRWDRL